MALIGAKTTADVVSVAERLHLSILSHLGIVEGRPLGFIASTTKGIYRGIQFAPNWIARNGGKPGQTIFEMLNSDRRSSEKLLNRHPFTQPFLKLTQSRSQGITDLKEGRVAQLLHLPSQIDCFAVAGLVRFADQSSHLVGDGLVTVNSALGRSKEAGESLNFPEANCYVANNVNHLGLLESSLVKDKIISWLAD